MSKEFKVKVNGKKFNAHKARVTRASKNDVEYRPTITGRELGLSDYVLKTVIAGDTVDIIFCSTDAAKTGSGTIHYGRLTANRANGTAAVTFRFWNNFPTRFKKPEVGNPTTIVILGVEDVHLVGEGY